MDTGGEIRALRHGFDSGCSPEVGHMVWDHGTAGSNPVTPIRHPCAGVSASDGTEGKDVAVQDYEEWSCIC